MFRKIFLPCCIHQFCVSALLLENREARRIVQELEDRVSNLTFDLETVRNYLMSLLCSELNSRFNELVTVILICPFRICNLL